MTTPKRRNLIFFIAFENHFSNSRPDLCVTLIFWELFQNSIKLRLLDTAVPMHIPAAYIDI